MKITIDKRDAWSKKNLKPWAKLWVKSVGWFTVWTPLFIIDIEYKAR